VSFGYSSRLAREAVADADTLAAAYRGASRFGARVIQFLLGAAWIPRVWIANGKPGFPPWIGRASFLESGRFALPNSSNAWWNRAPYRRCRWRAGVRVRRW
jgi:hypothetical protein